MVNPISSSAPVAARAAAAANTPDDDLRALGILAAGSHVSPDAAKAAMDHLKMQAELHAPHTPRYTPEGQTGIDITRVDGLLEDGQFSGFLKNFALDRLAEDSHVRGAEGVKVRESLQQTLTSYGLDPRDVDGVLADFDRRVEALRHPSAPAAPAVAGASGRAGLRPA